VVPGAIACLVKGKAGPIEASRESIALDFALGPDAQKSRHSLVIYPVSSFRGYAVFSRRSQRCVKVDGTLA